MTVRRAAAAFAANPAALALQAFLNRGIEPYPPPAAVTCPMRDCAQPVLEPGLWIARGRDYCSSKCARYADGS